MDKGVFCALEFKVPKIKAKKATHPRVQSVDAANLASITFIMRDGFSTFTLACTLDSLVRVPRRAGKDFFDKIALSPSRHPPTNSPHASTLVFLPVDPSILSTPPGTALSRHWFWCFRFLLR
jgi:hypothetical protein